MIKDNFYKLYLKTHNNAVDLLSEAKILFKEKKYCRAYFLAFTGLEEISKSQLAADVYTGFIKEDIFWKYYRNHNYKIDSSQWAHEDANSYPYNNIWIGPDIDDIEPISPTKPIWENRQISLYTAIIDGNIVTPKDKILVSDAQDIIHVLDTAISRIIEVTEYYGHQIGTKGFMK